MYSGIDGLRALCFLAVFFFHTNIKGFEIGWGGVIVFFVISGFLITEILINTKDSKSYFKSFYMRRILRIIPIYLLVLGMLTLLFVAKRHVFPNDIIYQLTYTQNILWVITNYTSDLQPFLAHTWTLAIEEQFYLIWPFLIWLIPNKYLPKLCISTIFFCILFRIISVLFFHNEYITSILLFSQIDSLALGALLACNYTKLTKKTNKQFDFFVKNAFYIGLIGIVLIVLFNSITKGKNLIQAYAMIRTPEGYINNIFTVQIYYFLAMIAVGLIYYCIHIDSKNILLKKILSNKFLAHLGKISYGLYLYHWPIIVLLKRAISNKYLLCFAALTLTYIVSVVSFNIFEKHFTNLKRKFVYNDTII